MRENKLDQNITIINFIKSLFDNNKFIPLHEPDLMVMKKNI